MTWLDVAVGTASGVVVAAGAVYLTIRPRPPVGRSEEPTPSTVGETVAGTHPAPQDGSGQGFS